jgi:nitrite reductase/ring-hydroxylating ferredoxin subunit
VSGDESGVRRVRVGTLEAIGAGTAQAVRLEPDERGHPRQAIVVRTDDGTLLAYRNECKHIPIPLDLFRGDFLDETRRHLVCVTHGALYRVEDGACVAGPCDGESLDPLPIRIEGSDVFVLDP